MTWRTGLSLLHLGQVNLKQWAAADNINLCIHRTLAALLTGGESLTLNHESPPLVREPHQ